MGNRLSSCGPLIRKAYRNEDTPWQNSRKRDGHLLRLWAEVFHVSTSSAGTVRWQQISEDLVPVNISCVQDQPDYVFHITAYNSQVDKILDVRLTQPGTRIGQASECFVYWKDPVTNDTWGLNFTSPADARAFRECCSPAFKFSRKASSSYSLRLESGRQKDQRLIQSTKRRTNSTPASPSHTSATVAHTAGGGGGGATAATAGRAEPQCTCMTPEQYARLRASQDPRFRAASMSLPRTQSLKRNASSSGSAVDAGAATAAGAAGSTSSTCATSETCKATETSCPTELKTGVSCANSSSSVYDNVQSGGAAANAAAAVSGTLKGRSTTVVENYATLRHPAPTNNSSEVNLKDATTTGVSTGVDDRISSAAAAVAAAMESKSSETQTSMATQTIQDQQQMPLSITHRTQQQQQPPPPMYSHQQYPAVAAQPAQQQQQQQQSMYNYYGTSNPIQVGGAIPRTYAQQQQQQQQQQMYHPMHPQQQQQSQTLNRYAGYGMMTGQQLNYGQQQQAAGAHPVHHYGTLQHQQPPPPQSMYGRDPLFQPHPQMQQQHHHQPAYYERAYSVQGDMIGGGDVRRSLSGIRGAPPQSDRVSSHPHRRDLISSKSVDYSTMMASGGIDPAVTSSNGYLLMDERERNRRQYHRSRSTENVNDYHHHQAASAAAMAAANKGPVMDPFGLDSDALKRMLQPVRSKSRTSIAAVSPNASPLTSPEMGRRSVGSRSVMNDGFQSEPEIGSRTPRFYASLSRVAAGGGAMPHQQQQQQHHQMLSAGAARSMSVNDRGGNGPVYPSRGVQSTGMLPPVQRTRSDALRQNLERNLYMDLDRHDTGSPALSDNILFDSHLCYATTPSSSNGNSDLENNGQLPAQAPPPPSSAAATSPTSRLLLEYEMHLRNTLAKGLDAESCSLHTFEALLSQSMEDLGSIIRDSNGPRVLPPQLRLLQHVEALVEDRYKNRHQGPLGHKFRNRLGGGGGGGGGRNNSGGTASTTAAAGGDAIISSSSSGNDRTSRLMRSDTIGSNRSMSNAMDVVTARSGNQHHHGGGQQQQLSTSVGGADGLERSVYSERDRGYLSDMSSRANSFYDRADSVRSGYLSDRESHRIGSGGFVQQTSIESNDSRLCYLTSSEMKRSFRTTSVRMVQRPPVRREEMDF